MLLFSGSALAGDGWLTSHAAAVKKSKKTGKPILADFTGSDWCGYCIRLHREVFGTAAFKSWAAKNVILLELDFPRGKPQSAALRSQNAQLARKYQIQGYPTILFLDASGNVLGESGYMSGGPQPWIKHASDVLKRKPGRGG